ncbi:MAG TPA: substrate-binding domain-containing protein [Beijerinckiaceae bacterium]|mgnify:CR=1 FL=1|nr:substrate-binding domain-containing protein [Beijerinckiaceae bacterium]
MATLRSLASDLGLSITTVSRALDGYEDVAAATRERVNKAAAAAGYRPNSTARRLRKGSSETVALVMPTEPGRFYEPVFVDLLSVLGERLAARHFDLMLLAARPGAEELAVYKRMIKDRRADACIIVRTRRHDERIAMLQEAGLPFVCHGRTETRAEYAYVDGDGEAGFREVTNRIVSLGHRRIAHLAAPDHFTFAELRSRGWHMAMRAAGLTDDLKLMCASTEEAGEQAATALLAGPDKPTALICATDRIAIGAVRAAQAAGLVVGRDIAVTGHDNIHASRFTHPAITTMELDVRSVGACLADKLLHLVERGMPEHAGDVFPLRQVLRASSGEAN